MPGQRIKLEICTGSIHSALAAAKAGANRIELCDNLSEGGTTPSAGMISVVLDRVDIPVFPIIRPRGGDFTYSKEEFEAMKADIHLCRDLGCRGVVFGILDHAGNIDIDRCRQLIEIAHPMQLTFHRAFDRCPDKERSLEEIISLGFDRLLSSGGADSAPEAIPQLRSLVKQSAGRVIVMPGAGITSSNIREMAEQTGAQEFHSTAKFGARLEIRAGQDPGRFFETDPDEVEAIKSILSTVRK